MKKWIALVSVAALAACAEAEAPAPEAAEEAVEEVAESVVVPGTYEVTYPDGSVTTTTINDDGTFSGSNAEGEASGTVAEVDGKACFDVEGDDEGAVCWTAGEQGEDGSFTSTADDGTVVTVKPVVEEAAAEG